MVRFLSVNPGDKHVVTSRCHCGCDLSDLLNRFALSENDLWEPAANPTVMIYLGKTKVLERQGLEQLGGLLGLEASLADRLQQFD